MTREEAIRLATGLRTDFKCESETMVDFCNTIIEALEQQPCEDCISREAVLEFIEKQIDHSLWAFGKLVNGIKNMPSVTPQPKIGRWIKTPKAVMDEGYMWYCDNCEYQVYQDSSKKYPSEKYCPNCGAKMEEDKE